MYSISSVQQLKTSLDTNTQQIVLIEAGSEFIDPSKSIFNYLNGHFKLKSTKDIFEIYKVHSFVKK